MSTISGLSASGLSSYLSKIYAKSSSSEETQDTTQTSQSTGSSDALAMLMQVVQSNAANSTSSSSDSGTQDERAYSSLSSFDSSMMSSLMQGQETQTTTSLEDMVTAMDTDGDGSVSKEEFLAARPDDVSEDMASTLWDSFDTEGAGSLTTDALETAMEAGRSNGPPPPPSDTASSEDEDSSTTVSAMDTNGDGIITQEEFLAARPDDVSEEMASTLWNSIDTEGTGSLSTDELETAMEAGRSEGPPPPPSDVASSEETEDTSFISAMDTDGDGIVTQAEFLAARPVDVTEEMASTLWESFDTEGAGELTTDALQTAMTEGTSSTQVASATEALETTSFDGLDYQMLLDAIRSYDLSAGYENMSKIRSSLQAMV